MVAMLAATGAVVATAGCSGTQSRAAGCSKDTDCKDPRVCERAMCVDPKPIGAAGSSVGAAGSPVGAEPSQPAGAPQPAGVPPFAMFGGDARHSGKRGGPA